MSSDVTHTIHNVTTTGVHGFMEHGYHWLGDLVGGSSGFFSASTLTLVAGVAIAAVASSVINIVKHRNLRADIFDMYRDEIASKLGKSPSQVTSKDMDALAKGVPERGIEANQTIADELTKLKDDRNLGIGVTLISIICAIPLAGWIGGGLAFSGAALSLANAGVFLGKLAIGFVCHKAIEYPVEAAGQEFFHMEGHSTHERIEGLMKDRAAGKELSKEKVLGVFISANKELSQFVQQQFGNEYDKLSLPVKQKIVDTFEQFVPLTQVTESLNSGKVRITELAFSVSGQSSGILPSEKPTPPKLNVVGKARGLMHNMSAAISNVHGHVQQGRAQNYYAQPPVVAQPSEPLRPKRQVVYYDNPEPKISFTEQLARRRGAQAQGLEAGAQPNEPSPNLAFR